MNTPNDAMRNTKGGALFFLKGRYMHLSIAIPRIAENADARKKERITFMPREMERL